MQMAAQTLGALAQGSMVLVTQNQVCVCVCVRARALWGGSYDSAAHSICMYLCGRFWVRKHKQSGEWGCD